MPTTTPFLKLIIPEEGNTDWADTVFTAFDAIDSGIFNVSGTLQTQIDAVEGSDVDSINTLIGDITVTGSSNFPIRTEGQVITVSGADFITNLENAYDGSIGIEEAQTYSVSSDGVDITFTLDDAEGHATQVVQISGANINHPMPDTVTLTAAGTDTNPQENWVYLLEGGGSLTLTSNTTGFPAAAHARVARVIVQTAEGVAASGVLKLHAYTDHMAEPDSRGNVGHIHAISERIRAQFAEWQEGTALTHTPDVGSSAGTITVQVSAGVIYQLHTHATPAMDTSGSDLIFLFNDFTTPYKTIQSLSEITEYNDGSSIGVAERFNVVIWGAVAENDSDSKLFLNLPDGGYNNDTKATNDSDNTAVYSIPGNYAGVAWLLARLTVKRSGGGGTWEILQNTDLRGASPSTFPGGIVIGGAGVTDHGLLTGLTVDADHPQYSLVDGTRAFTGVVGGIAPTNAAHLTRKDYVDTEISTVSGTLSAEIDADVATHAALAGDVHHPERWIIDDDSDTYVLVEYGGRGNDLDDIRFVAGGKPVTDMWTDGSLGHIGKDGQITRFQAQNQVEGNTYFKWLSNAASTMETTGINSGETFSIYNAGAGGGLYVKGEAVSDVLMVLEAPSMVDGAVLAVVAPANKSAFTGEYFTFTGKNVNTQDFRFSKIRVLIGAVGESLDKSLIGLGGGKHADSRNAITGTASAFEKDVAGTGTLFTNEVEVGDLLRFNNDARCRVVTHIIDDENLTISTTLTVGSVAVQKYERQYLPFMTYFENSTGGHVGQNCQFVGNVFGMWFTEQERPKYIKNTVFTPSGEEPSGIRNDNPANDEEGFFFVTEQDKDNDTVLVSGTGETTIYSDTIPGSGTITNGFHVYDIGKLGEKGVIRTTVQGTMNKQVGGDLTVRVKYGSTTAITETFSPDAVGDQYSWNFDVTLAASGTQYQKVFLKADGTTNAGDDSFMVRSYGTSAENSKYHLDLAVTAQWDTDDPDLTLSKEVAFSDIV